MNIVTFYVWWLVSTWFGLGSNYSYSKDWDSQLNHLLDNFGDDDSVDEYTANIGGVEIWIGNPLYAYGYERAIAWYKPYRRPSIKTMHRLYMCCEWVRSGKPSHG